MNIRDYFLLFIGLLSFGVLFNINRRLIVPASAVGLLGYAAYKFTLSYSSSLFFAVFIGAVVVGLLAEALARLLKKPATTFTIPGIIPLVPGLNLYRAMDALHDMNQDLAMQEFLGTVIISLSLATGIMLALSFSRILYRKKPLRSHKAKKAKGSELQ